MIKAVIFDMDGVLIDSEVEYVKRFSDLFNRIGLTFTKQDASQIIGSSSQRTNEVLKELLCDKLSIDEFWTLWRKELADNPIDYSQIRVEGAKEVISTLKDNGYKIGIASATELERIKEQMHDADLLHYFDAISSGHEFENSKPHPDVYLATLDRLGINHNECIVVEDSFYGIQAGKSAGCYVVGRKVNEFDIDQRKADELITDLRQVLTVVERIQGV